MSRYFSDFDHAINWAFETLKTHGEDVDPGTWQGVPTDPSMVTREVMNLSFSVPVERHIDDLLQRLRDEIQPNLPWADQHFEERVSRVPSNPGEAYKNWPWWRGQDEVTMSYESQDGKHFTHTYQERFWPKHTQADWESTKTQVWPKMKGIRYEYGDLDDVIELLLKNPYTRQATFPIFFPEDTGAVHGGRIPCTLHYHFLLRHDQLNMWYPIRSCDAIRHFRDDLYLAARLQLWVLDELLDRELRDVEGLPQVWNVVRPGQLHFTAYSFHVHKGDIHHVH